MADVELTADNLIIHIRGLDEGLSFRLPGAAVEALDAGQKKA